MLCAIRVEDRAKLDASCTNKSDGPFACPKCQEDVIIRKGNIKIHHFSHLPFSTCGYGVGESEAHRRCKRAIYDALSTIGKVSYCELERDLGTVIPDIYAVIDGTSVAIEIQLSNLSVNEITRRTRHYNNLNIHVLWLPLASVRLDTERYAPKAWEKWLHAAYFGRVYYWVDGISVMPVHFDEYMIDVDEAYNSDGEEVGGYSYRSKRWRRPVCLDEMSIVDDFYPSKRKGWNGGTVNIPECRLYIGKQRGSTP